MTLLIIYAAVALGFSFLCSVLEASLLSITPSFIAQQRENRPRLFERLRALKDNIDDPLAAILTLNTIAHTAGATGVGAQVAVVFGEAYLGAASAVMTLAILIFSEIIPKTIGAKFWRSLAPMLPATLKFIMVPLKPFIWLSNMITRRIGANEPETDFRAEIRALADISFDREALDADEKRMIRNVLGLHEITVDTIMTPRQVTEVVAPHLTVAEFRGIKRHKPFTRYPVINAKNEALGYVHAGNLLTADDDVELGELAHDMAPFRSDMSVERVFTDMLRRRQHMGLVYNELGTWVGLVTIEDVIESILGQEIMDETDKVADLRRYARERWTH